MKFLYNIALLLISLISCISFAEEKRIVLVIASYNNIRWCKSNLITVFKQKYENYLVIYINDCSSDGTGEEVKRLILEYGMQDKVIFVDNTERKGALANQYHAIHSCQDTDVIAILDGDDRLANEHVLARINQEYQDPNVWLTYGQFKEYPSNAIGFCCPMPDHVVQNNSFRTHNHIPSHMRTFYAGLFKRIKKEDLCDSQGNFLMMTGDIAAMFPMIEMAREHFRFIPDVLYVYNGANILNDHKVSKSMQRAIDLLIRSRSPYEKLTSLFLESDK